jgi:hypothetical protein
MTRFVLLLVVLAASLAGAGPSSLVAVDAGSAPAGQPYYGRVGRFALLVDGPGERIALDPHQPSYVVFLQKPGIESQVSAVAPVLLCDGKTFLMQLNDEQTSRVRLAGCELFRLPDTPVFRLPAAVSPPFYPRPFRPDSFILRLVNRVSAVARPKRAFGRCLRQQAVAHRRLQQQHATERCLVLDRRRELDPGRCERSLVGTISIPAGGL